MKKVLMLAYFYPPSGGAGVQRTIKFAKYLPEFGWLPQVVAGTGSGSQFHQDPELVREVASVRRYDVQFFPFEKKINTICQSPVGRWARVALSAWMKAATRTLSAAIEKDRPDILFVTTSPFPAAKAAAETSKKYGIPWVLDMRDPWALDPICRYPTKLHYFLELREMKNACYQADAVIMNTPGALSAVIRKFCDLNPLKFHCITNGWDANDFRLHQEAERKCCEPMKIVHTGVFHTKTAKLLERINTPLATLRHSLCEINLLTRTPNYLFAACRKLIDEKKIPVDALQFIFAGSESADDVALAKEYQLEYCVKFSGYLNHDKSINLLHQGDVLFLPLHQLSDGRNPLIVPGKAYEYMASKRPILACVPEGDTRDIVLKSGLAYVCDPSDIESIAKTIRWLVEQFKLRKSIPKLPNDGFIESFERRRLTEELAQIFEIIMAGR